MKYILIFALTFIGPFQCIAGGGKSGNNLRTADELFAIGRYYDAITYYTKAAEADPKSSYVVSRLAESYYLARDYVHAETYYSKLYEMDAANYKKALYWKGIMMKMNGKYDEAKKVLDEFQKSIKGSDAQDWKRKAKTEKEGCDLAKNLLAKPLNCTIDHLDKSINSYYTEYAPKPLGSNEILFSSMRADEDIVLDFDGPNNVFAQLYIANKVNDKINNEWHHAKTMTGPFNTSNAHIGDACYSTDRKRFYFTRCEVNDDGIMICSIYMSEKKNNEWKSPKKLGEEVNANGVSSTSPSVAIVKGGTEILYFVTEGRTGGVGGKDIWFVSIDKFGNLKNPTNCGRKVNTEGDEITPFYDTKASALFFSSNGHPGVGGFDIFIAKGNSKKFADAVNIGMPINSSVDDMYYVTDRLGDGYFVSNRKGIYGLKGETCCDDIFAFTYPKPIRIAVEGYVVESIDNDKYYSNGGATVSLWSLDGETKEEAIIAYDTLTAKRQYYFDIFPNMAYKLSASKDGYLTGFTTLSTLGLKASDTLQADITIIKIIQNKSIVIKDIYYDFDKATLRPESQIGLDSVLLFLNENPDIIVELSAHTDSKGSDAYNLDLSQRRAQSVVDYLLIAGIDSTRLVAKGYGETRPVALNENSDGTDNPDGRQQNRRTELTIIGQVKGVNINYESNRTKYVSIEDKAKAIADSVAITKKTIQDAIKKAEEEAAKKAEEETAKKAEEDATKTKIVINDKPKDKDKKTQKEINTPCTLYEPLLDKNGLQVIERHRTLFVKNITIKEDPSTDCKNYIPLMDASGKQRKEKSKLLWYRWEEGIKADSVLAIELAEKKLQEERDKIKDLPTDDIPKNKDVNINQAKTETPQAEPCKDYKPFKNDDGSQKFKDGIGLFYLDIPAGAKASKSPDCSNYKKVMSKDGKVHLKIGDKALYSNENIKEGTSINSGSIAVGSSSPCKDFSIVKGPDGNQIIKDGTKALFIKNIAPGVSPDKSADCSTFKPLMAKDGKTQIKNPEGKLLYYKEIAGSSSTSGGPNIGAKNPCDNMESYLDANGAQIKIDGKSVYLGPSGCKDFTPILEPDGKTQKKTPDGKLMFF